MGMFGGNSKASAAGCRSNLGHIIDANTLALWRFDEPTGATSIIDYSGNNHHWDTLASGTTRAVGKVGNGRLLSNGVLNSTYCLMSNQINQSTWRGDYTIEFWVKWNGVSNGFDYAADLLTSRRNTDHYTSVYISLGSQYSASPYNLPSATWMRNSGTYQGCGLGVLSSSVWTHLAFVRKYNSLLWDAVGYQNGVQYSISTGNTDTDLTGAETLVLHGYPSGIGSTAMGFGGVINDMRISNVARTPTEILESYTRGTSYIY